MATCQKSHYFYEGRKSKNNGNPGILVVEGKYRFRLNKVNKDRSIFKMYCLQQGNPEFACKAKATVVKRDDGSFFLYSCDDYHNHLVIRSVVVAEELKQRMAEIVRKDPASPVGDAIRTVKLEAAKEYWGDEDFFREIVDSLGSHHSMELRLLRIRDRIIGSMPRSRDRFDPKCFMNRIYGKDHNIDVLDSNKLPDNWTEILDRKNPNSQYYWDRLNENLRTYEHHSEEQSDLTEGALDEAEENIITDVPDVDLEDVDFEGPEEPPPASKNLPILLKNSYPYLLLVREEVLMAPSNLAVKCGLSNLSS